jgi:hypothetical protein
VQSLVLSHTDDILESGSFRYETISNTGSPEFPSWSESGDTLFWSAYTNGVSNIYRTDIRTNKTVAVSHTVSGLFRPVSVSSDSLFAFEFSPEGFIAVLLPNKPAQKLPALHYLGQSVLDRNPQLTDWTLPVLSTQNSQPFRTESGKYRGIGALQINTLIPVVSGFQNQTVLGFYARVSDPLLTHDFLFEIGVSPFYNRAGTPDLHFKGHYEYRKNHKLEIELNAPSFYDLVNKRKAGMSGDRYAYINTHYWKYDEPHEIKQTSELSVYRGVRAIFDNEVAVSEPDFAVFESALNSKNIRRTIGSIDSESGYDWTFTLVGLSASPSSRQWGGGFHAEWNWFNRFLFPHNIAHIKIAAGYVTIQNELEIGKYYFGGFGNQYLDYREVRQYRDSFRFPGIPIYGLAAERFARLMFEHTMPPVRFHHLQFSGHGLSHIDLSWFSQALVTDAATAGDWVDLGAQLNLVFNHWYNLESTLSFGIAKAWSSEFSDWDWMVSFKILRD